MAYNPPRKNVQYIFYIGLVSQSTGQLQANPTIAAGDFKVSTDGGAFGNLGTLPAVTPAGGKAVKVTLSNTEMNGDNVAVIGSDAAGAEWNDIIVSIQPSIAYSADGVIDSNLTRIDGQATNGNNATLKLKNLDIRNTTDAAITAQGGEGFAGLFLIGVSAPGLQIESQAGIDPAVQIIGTGDGVYIESDDGHAIDLWAIGGDAFHAEAAGTNGHGVNAIGIGTGKSINAPNDIAVSDGNLTVANVKLISAGQITVKKNVALPNFAFVMTDTDGLPATGLTVAAERRIDSGSFAACANTPATELANGWYTIDLADSDLNGTIIALRFSDTGAADTNFTIITQD